MPSVLPRLLSDKEFGPLMQMMKETWTDSIPGWEDALGGNDSPLRFSGWDNPVDRGLQIMVDYRSWGSKESDMIKQLSHVHIHILAEEKQ